MSLLTLAILNTLFVAAVVAGLAAVTRLPFLLDRSKPSSALPESEPLRLAA